jgi:hypothetical protein
MSLNVLVKELRDSVLFSVSKTVFSTFVVYCAYGCAHTFSNINYMKSSCVLLLEIEFCKVWNILG